MWTSVFNIRERRQLLQEPVPALRSIRDHPRVLFYTTIEISISIALKII
jgi:hypothetical protein